MKKLIKYFGVMLTAAFMCLALFACGGNGTKYNYKEAKVEGNSNMSSIATMYDAIYKMYDAIYKGSYIEVGDSSIKWTMSDQEQKMTYKKDGDKYSLGGKYTELLKDTLAGMGAGNMEIAVWGAETEEGFKIVIENTIGDNVIRFVCNFTKA